MTNEDIEKAVEWLNYTEGKECCIDELEDVYHTIRTCLKQAMIAQEMAELSNKAKEFSDLDQTSGNIWIPRAIQVSDEDFEWTQELLGTTDEELAKFLIDVIKALAKWEEMIE